MTVIGNSTEGVMVIATSVFQQIGQKVDSCLSRLNNVIALCSCPFSNQSRIPCYSNASHFAGYVI